MTYTKVSIPKRGSAGSPVPKDPNILIIKVDDIASTNGDFNGYPARDSGGVKMTANFTLKDGKKALAIYATRSTIKRFDTSEGTEDAMGFIQNVEFEHPGDQLELAEFVQNEINEDVIIITRECSDATGTRVHGTPCNPMKLTYEQQDDNEAKKSMMKFATPQRSKFKTAHYYGQLPATYDVAGEVQGSGSSSGGI